MQIGQSLHNCSLMLRRYTTGTSAPRRSPQMTLCPPLARIGPGNKFHTADNVYFAVHRPELHSPTPPGMRYWLA